MEVQEAKKNWLSLVLKWSQPSGFSFSASAFTFYPLAAKIRIFFFVGNIFLKSHCFASNAWSLEKNTNKKPKFKNKSFGNHWCFKQALTRDLGR